MQGLVCIALIGLHRIDCIALIAKTFYLTLGSCAKMQSLHFDAKTDMKAQSKLNNHSISQILPVENEFLELNDIDTMLILTG